MEISAENSQFWRYQLILGLSTVGLVVLQRLTVSDPVYEAGSSVNHLLFTVPIIFTTILYFLHARKLKHFQRLWQLSTLIVLLSWMTSHFGIWNTFISSNWSGSYHLGTYFEASINVPLTQTMISILIIGNIGVILSTWITHTRRTRTQAYPPLHDACQSSC
jgi:IS1 family transposase